MKPKTNTIRINYENNSELQSAIGGRKPGDELELKVTIVVTANDAGNLEGSVRAIEPEEEADRQEEGDSAEAEGESEGGPQPILLVMGEGARE